jgi:mycothiol system anti-sigma-R factor
MTEAHVIDCEEALRRLFAYLDSELHGEQQREMEEHLRRCRSCFSRVEFEKRLKTHVAELGKEPVSPDLEQRVRALLDTLKF